MVEAEHVASPEKEWRDHMVEVYARRMSRLLKTYRGEIPASARLF